MSLGSAVYQLRCKYKHGPRVAHWRDVVRPRILQTAPVPDTTDLSCEIHVLTSAQDHVNLLWTLKSFYRYSGRRYALCIHDDGTLKPEQRDLLQHHFPAARLIDRGESDAAMAERLRDYPRAAEFRRTNHLAPKVFDFIAHLQCERMLLLDSDVLFFAAPQALLERLENSDYRLNTVNADVASAFTVEPEAAQKLAGVQLIPRFNSGLGLIHRDSMRLDWIEEFLALPGIVGHFWRIEQTLFALCSSRFGAELLPTEYNVRLDKGLNGVPSRHYVGPIRHLMYGEGIAHLTRSGFLGGLEASR